MLNVFIPAYGPQLKKILVGLTLFDPMIIGTVVISDAMQGDTLYEEEEEEEEEELEDEDEDELETKAVQAVLVIVF